jgi:hypothetical protein
MSSYERRPRKKRRLLLGCGIAAAGVVALIAILIVGYGVSRRLQESKEYDLIEKLGKKYPGYLLLYNIETNPRTMTDAQLSSYEKGLVGKGCVGMGRVVNVEKTMGSSVLDLFGLNAPGTIITLVYEEYDIELILAQSYTDEFLTYNPGDTVLFAGIIRRATIDDRTHLSLLDVIIEGHRK